MWCYRLGQPFRWDHLASLLLWLVLWVSLWMVIDIRKLVWGMAVMLFIFSYKFLKFYKNSDGLRSSMVVEPSYSRMRSASGIAVYAIPSVNSLYRFAASLPVTCSAAVWNSGVKCQMLRGISFLSFNPYAWNVYSNMWKYNSSSLTLYLGIGNPVCVAIFVVFEYRSYRFCIEGNVSWYVGEFCL